jgi:Skp family chaperone for outer membrane proteins
MISVRLALCIAVLCAAPALAQQPATPPPPPTTGPPLGGPLIAGVCLLSQPAVFTNAKVAVAAANRLKQLSDQAQAEIDLDRKPLEAEGAAVNAPGSKLAPGDKAARLASLTTRAQALQAKATLRTREIEATRLKATQRIGLEEQPVIAEVYRAHKCGLLFDRNTVLGGNMGGDLTAEVVGGLDARITTMTFDRESLPPQ